MEPSTAVVIHDALGLPPSCQNFDVTNACLGFMNGGVEIAAAMIDAGLVEHALVVDSEDSQPVQESTIKRLSTGDITSRDLMSEFAALTPGSGAVAMVLGRADRHPEGHRLVGGVSRAATQHHELCVGDNETMKTDLKGPGRTPASSCPPGCGPKPRVSSAGTRHQPLLRAPDLTSPHRRDL